jgi:hypothetical protein
MSENKIYKTISDFFYNNHKPEIIIGLCTTSTKGNKSLNYLSYPRKISKNCFYFHLIIENTKTAISLTKKLVNLVDTFFIDTEIKNKDFDWKIILSDLLKHNISIDFLKIEPNNLTVNKILSLIGVSNSLSILIIGAGNIAFSLADRLEKSNFYFNWIKIGNKNSASYKKMFKSYKQFHLTKPYNKFDIIINTIPAETKIELGLLIKNKSFFIEVSSSSLNYLSYIHCKKIKLDISDEITQFIKQTLASKKKPNLIGRKMVKNRNICSGGIIGEAGDIVVDNFKKPKYTVGIADGKGGFKSRFIIPFKEYINNN